MKPDPNAKTPAQEAAETAKAIKDTVEKRKAENDAIFEKKKAEAEQAAKEQEERKWAHYDKNKAIVEADAQEVLKEMDAKAKVGAAASKAAKG